MKVFSIHLGNVEASSVEAGLTALAHELGYAKLQVMYKDLSLSIFDADENNPVDIADERELEEIKFMMSVFQDADGFVKEDIPF